MTKKKELAHDLVFRPEASEKETIEPTEDKLFKTEPLTIREKAKLAHELSSALDNDSLKKSVLAVAGGSTLWALLVSATESELSRLMGDTAVAEQEISGLIGLVGQLESSILGLFQGLSKTETPRPRNIPQKPLTVDLTRPMVVESESYESPIQNSNFMLNF
jgi:hypothetical protein